MTFAGVRMQPECEECRRAFDPLQGGLCERCRRLLCGRHLHGFLNPLVTIGLVRRTPLCRRCRAGR